MKPENEWTRGEIKSIFCSFTIYVEIFSTIILYKLTMNQIQSSYLTLLKLSFCFICLQLFSILIGFSKLWSKVQMSKRKISKDTILILQIDSFDILTFDENWDYPLIERLWEDVWTCICKTAMQDRNDTYFQEIRKRLTFIFQR